MALRFIALTLIASYGKFFKTSSFLNQKSRILKEVNYGYGSD